MTDQHSLSTLGCYGNPRTDAGTRSVGRQRDPLHPCLHPDGDLHPGAGQPPDRCGTVSPQAAGQLRTQCRLHRGPGRRPVHVRRGAARRGLAARAGGQVARRCPPDRRRLRLPGADVARLAQPGRPPRLPGVSPENDLPPYRISDPVRGVLPSGDPGNLMAARLHQPVEATFEHYLASRTIQCSNGSPPIRAGAGSSSDPFLWAAPAVHPAGRVFRHATTRTASSCRSRCTRHSPTSRRCSVTTARTGRSTRWTRPRRKLVAAYWGYVTLIDHEIGRVLDAVERLGLADRTAVIFTADHGEFTGAHRLHDKGPAMYERSTASLG